MDIQAIIEELRVRFEKDHVSYIEEFGTKEAFRIVDLFLQDENRSDLERAFFLILNQFPDTSKPYIIRPGEMVLIPDIYDLSCPGIEYEIDFALYGGSIENPVKVAIECDGIRSHGQKHTRKDRRKDVNLQAAGWLVMRFSSREIHQELQRFRDEEHHISDFLLSITNTIEEKLRLINYNSFRQNEFKLKLTGYKWGKVICENCSNSLEVILNHRNVKCHHCGTKFKRSISTEEKIKYEMNGIIYFEE